MKKKSRREGAEDRERATGPGRAMKERPEDGGEEQQGHAAVTEAGTRSSARRVRVAKAAARKAYWRFGASNTRLKRARGRSAGGGARVLDEGYVDGGRLPHYSVRDGRRA